MKTTPYGLIIITLAAFLHGCDGQTQFPASLMEMNKPEYLLKDSLFWNRSESEHFLYYSSVNVDRDLMGPITKSQEANIAHIANVMNIRSLDNLPKIKLWIFDSDREKYRKTQVNSNAHTLTEYWSTYYNKDNATGAHEIGHLMTQHYWGYPKSRKYDFLLQEGFAFYVDEGGFFAFDFSTRAKSILRNDRYRISTILQENNNDDFEKKAVVCGAFVKYLITTYGIESFAALWKTLEVNDNAFVTIYGNTFSDLEKEFYRYLSSVA